MMDRNQALGVYTEATEQVWLSADEACHFTPQWDSIATQYMLMLEDVTAQLWEAMYGLPYYYDH